MVLVLARGRRGAVERRLRQGRKKDAPRPPAEVTVLTVAARDVPISSVFVAQTQSSQAVTHRGARVGLPRQARLHRRRGGQGGPGPVQDGPEAVPGAGRRRRRPRCSAIRPRCEVATANLDAHQAARRAERAVAEGPRRRARASTSRPQAAVAQGKAQLEAGEAQSLVHDDHVARRRRLAASRRSPTAPTSIAQNSQLTTVSVLTPMWINFSISENEMERIRNEVRKGQLKLPDGNQFVVEIELVDGIGLPEQGQDHVRRPVVQLADRNVPDPRVGRQPQGRAAPEPVRAHAADRRRSGRTRSSCRSAPCSRARKGHFVWVVNKGGKAELRPVVVGDWYGDNWFIAQGLAAGDQVVVDGALQACAGRAGQGDGLCPEAGVARKPRRVSRPTGGDLDRQLSRAASATLDAEAMRLLEGLRAAA